MSTKNTGSGPGISDISVVVPSNGERQEELKQVIKNLEDFGFKDIIIATGNKLMMNRYEAALKAKNDIIYTQDDDCVILNIDDIVNAYNPDKIIANIKLAHINHYANYADGKIALVGWGAIFNKKLINFDKYLARFPEDEFLYREADRVFTWLNDFDVIIADGSIKDFPSAVGGMSVTPEHFPSMVKMVERLRTL